MSEMKVELVDFMGDDLSVCRAARVSFAKDPQNFTNEQNEKLINYLAEHKHDIPFAHTAITVRVQAPIAIRTQCFKHKVGFVENELSRRYVTDKPTYFVPTFRTKPDGNIKQGSGDIHAENDLLRKVYADQVKWAIETYEGLLANNVAPEQARLVLPQGVMTEWVWTGSLLAFARFYNLRSKPEAQKEIQELAEMVGKLVKTIYPVSWEALTKQGEQE